MKKLIRIVNYILIAASVLFCVLDCFSVTGGWIMCSYLFFGFWAYGVGEYLQKHHYEPELKNILAEKYNYNEQPMCQQRYSIPKENEKDYFYELAKGKAGIEKSLWKRTCIFFPVFAYSVAVFFSKIGFWVDEEDRDGFIYGDWWYVYLSIAVFMLINYVFFRDLHTPKEKKLANW